MIATSKFAKAVQRATETKPYTEGVFHLVTELAETAGDITHPLITGTDSKDAKDLTLVMCSDRGLCGPYNGTILRLALSKLKNADPEHSLIDLVGKKGASFLKFNGVHVDEHHQQFGDKPEVDDVDRLAQSYMDRFIAGELASVRVIYMRFVSAGRQEPEVMQLLPLKPPAAKESQESTGSAVLYEFSPEIDELLDELLPAAVRATLFQCFNDAVVSEHIARMVAMKAATDNAGKMGTSLKRKFNRARQSQITTELTEIISGAAALE